MSKGVPPLQVSPFIKAARWTFLISGIVYGILKLRAYRLLESKIAPLRARALKEKNKQLAEQQHIAVISDVKTLCEELGITELPQGWENEI